MAFPSADALQAYAFRATKRLSGDSSVPPRIIFYDKVFVPDLSE